MGGAGARLLDTRSFGPVRIVPDSKSTARLHSNTYINSPEIDDCTVQHILQHILYVHTSRVHMYVVKSRVVKTITCIIFIFFQIHNVF